MYRFLSFLSFEMVKLRKQMIYLINESGQLQVQSKIAQILILFLFVGADDTMFEKFSLGKHLYIFTYTNTIYVCIWQAAHIKDRLPDTELTNVCIYICTYICTYV